MCTEDKVVKLSTHTLHVSPVFPYTERHNSFISSHGVLCYTFVLSRFISPHPSNQQHAVGHDHVVAVVVNWLSVSVPFYSGFWFSTHGADDHHVLATPDFSFTHPLSLHFKLFDRGVSQIFFQLDMSEVALKDRRWN